MRLKTMDLLKRFSHIPGYAGHTHFWERLTRRRFLTTAAGALGLALGPGCWMPHLAGAAEKPGVLPKPIPGGSPLAREFCKSSSTEIFHVFFIPSSQVTTFPDLSTITDFDGVIGGADVLGNVTRLDKKGSTSLFFDNDMRFMKGRYIGVDGQEHTGTFGFI